MTDDRSRQSRSRPDSQPSSKRSDEPDARAEVDPDVAMLLGLRPADASDLPDEDEVDDLGRMTDTAMDEGGLDARVPGSDQPDIARLESLLDDEARAGETDDPDEAAEEGLTWVPPTDPPVIASDAPGGASVAAGFGTTAEDEPFDADHHGEALPADDERTSRVVEALRADARTSAFADQLIVDSDGGLVRIEGRVADLGDEDAALEVAEEVPGVTEVLSEIVVEALEGSEPG